MRKKLLLGLFALTTLSGCMHLYSNTHTVPESSYGILYVRSHCDTTKLQVMADTAIKLYNSHKFIAVAIAAKPEEGEYLNRYLRQAGISSSLNESEPKGLFKTFWDIQDVMGFDTPHTIILKNGYILRCKGMSHRKTHIAP